jgi:hypothetical protein
VCAVLDARLEVGVGAPVDEEEGRPDVDVVDDEGPFLVTVVPTVGATKLFTGAFFTINMGSLYSVKEWRVIGGPISPLNFRPFVKFGPRCARFPWGLSWSLCRDEDVYF